MLSQIEKARINRLLSKWVDHVPPHVRDQLRYGFRIGVNDVVMFESRPRFQHPDEWRDEEIAKFRYVNAAKQWRLYCQMRDLKWRAYQPLPSADTFEELFEEVLRDSTGIFFG